jgi:L-galactose dehydrogenase
MENLRQVAASTLSGLEYRQLGVTSLRVSIASFGASPLGNVFRQTDPAEGVRAVHYAIDQGINFFDVSPYYGLTLAESRLGEALAGHRDKIVLATKCGRYGEGEFNFSAARVMKSIDESLTRLRTDHVDLLQAHDVEFGDLNQIVEETIPAMRALQQQGKTRYIGITGYPPAMLIRIAERAHVDSILSYCRYNLMMDDMESSLVPFAREHGIALINASALHMGILTERGAPDWHPAPAAIREAGKRVVEACRARGLDVSEVALRYCFDHPGVASTLVGMSTREHVAACLDSLRMRSDPQLLAEIREAVGADFNYVWSSGRTENN